MRYVGIYVLFILIAAGTALPAFARAEDAAEERWEHKLCELGDLKERLANPPPRDPKIERPDEPYKMSLKNVGPQWIEQKYVAIVRVEVPEPGTMPNYRRDASSTFRTVNTASEPQLSQIFRDDKELILLQSLPDGSVIIAPKYRPGFGEAREAYFKRLVKNTPENRRPDQAEIDHFTGDTPFTWGLGHKEKSDREFLISAPTAELAERRARALLTLLDQGLSRTLQLALYEKLDTACKHLQELQATIDKHAAEEKQLAEESKQYAGFKADMLEPLRLQELQLEIELAGIKARIAGCDKVLAQPGLDAERKKNVEDLKIAAEIELLAIDARRAKAAELLAKVKESTELAIKHVQLNAQLQRSINDYKQAANQIAKIHEEIRWFAPMPLVDDKIIVQELKFTQ